MRNLRTAALVAAGALIIGGFVTGFVPGAAAQAGEAAVKITGPTEEVKEGDQPIAFDVTADNVKNLGGFQFVVLYNDRVLEFDSAQKGDFPGSSGREVVCNDPITAPGSVRLSCNTLRPLPAGPDGSGKLMTVMLKPKGHGNTDVTLDRVKLVSADETATEITPVSVQNTSLSVADAGGMNWLLWGPVIAIGILAVAGAVAFAAMRFRGSAGSPAPTAT